jgi:hypothetical protein
MRYASHSEPPFKPLPRGQQEGRHIDRQRNIHRRASRMTNGTPYLKLTLNLHRHRRACMSGLLNRMPILVT